jgi:hypothetical protein
MLENFEFNIQLILIDSVKCAFAFTFAKKL